MEATAVMEGWLTKMIQALYVDTKRGPYPRLVGPENCWGQDRDATQYQGPFPVVAHPPCGHWGRYAHKCHDDGRTGPMAVIQVREFGGVLEHPKDSKLWRYCGLPRPGELPDGFGGFTLLVYQRDWGHPADKPTWLYFVGITLEELKEIGFPPSVAPREAWVDSRRKLKDELANPSRKRGTRGIVDRMSKNQRHITPFPFAAWLVEIAKKIESRKGRL